MVHQSSDIGGGFGPINQAPGFGIKDLPFHIVDGSDLDLLPAEEGMHSGAVDSDIQPLGSRRGDDGFPGPGSLHRLPVAEVEFSTYRFCYCTSGFVANREAYDLFQGLHSLLEGHMA